MLTDPKFRRAFRFIVLVTVGQFLLAVIYAQLFAKSVSQEANMRFFTLSQIIVVASLWWAIAEVSGKRKEAMISLGITLLFIILPISLFIKSQQLFFIKRLAEALLPFGVFGYLAFKDQRAVWMLLAGAVHLSIQSLTASQDASLYQWLERALRVTGHYMPRHGGIWVYIDTLIYLLANLPFLFLAFSYLYKILEKNQQQSFFETKWIDVTNIYSKRMATTIYLLLNGWITVLAFGLLTRFPGAPNKFLLRLDYVLTEVSLLATLYFVSLMFRNFLVEYSLQTNRKPGWAYFFWHIPIIGVIGWFVHLSSNKNIAIDRLSLFKQSQEHTNKDIKTFMILVACSRILLLLVSNVNTKEATYLFLGEIIVSVLLTVWFVERANAKWWILGSLAFIVGYVLLLNREIALSYVLYAVPNVIVLYPLFHASQIENIAEVSDKEQFHSEPDQTEENDVE
ncbi:MAG TPA: hypothetical protein DCS93_30355 [Microscillaceae bacterium]|nr:hypothetical protein [Microscillaceae bacterium]